MAQQMYRRATRTRRARAWMGWCPCCPTWAQVLSLFENAALMRAVELRPQLAIRSLPVDLVRQYRVELIEYHLTVAEVALLANDNQAAQRAVANGHAYLEVNVRAALPNDMQQRLEQVQRQILYRTTAAPAVLSVTARNARLMVTP